MICWIVIAVGIITFFIAICCIYHIVKLCGKLADDKKVSLLPKNDDNKALKLWIRAGNGEPTAEGELNNAAYEFYS